MGISVRTRNKIFAVLAGGLVVGVGTAVTLATWTDTEWAFGGNAAGTGPGVGTSTFAVQQNVTNPYAVGSAFTQAQTNPGSTLKFTLNPLALTPGDSVYAPIALETSATSVAGTLQLNPAVAATGITAVDAGNALFNNLRLAVGVVSTAPTAAPPTCDAAGFASFTPITVANGGVGLGSAPATATQSLSAATGNVLHYCFRISMPATTDPLVGGVTITQLQGRSVAPAWSFTGTSL
jgi:predicted ribosomally synthesized peptide with SipW-like signal peptide